MAHLPIPAFTSRHSPSNLASVLPELFVKPDIGPTISMSYGLGIEDFDGDEACGTKNLHVEKADYFSMLISVGSTVKAKPDEVAKKLRCSGDLGKVGCVWHVFRPSDADKIRDFLNKTANEERRKKIETNFDPLLEGKSYLNSARRKSLSEQYGVSPFIIHQRLGDAVFIPAGAPRQVTCVESCAAVNMGFISADNVSLTFHMTQEARYTKKLSMPHFFT